MRILFVAESKNQKMYAMRSFMTACYLTRLLRLDESYECVESETSVQTSCSIRLLNTRFRWRKNKNQPFRNDFVYILLLVLICSLIHSLTVIATAAFCFGCTMLHKRTCMNDDYVTPSIYQRCQTENHIYTFYVLSNCAM